VLREDGEAVTFLLAVQQTTRGTEDAEGVEFGEGGGDHWRRI
jgi:hypothetical protein